MQFEIPLDYSVLRKYNPQIELLAQLKESKHQERNIVLHTVSTPYSIEEFEEFDKKYNDLLKKYGLQSHQGSLLFFAGTLFESFEQAQVAREDFKLAYASLKKIAQLLKMQEECDLQELSITVKGTQVADTVSIDKGILVQAVFEPLIKNLYHRISSPVFNNELSLILKDVEFSYKSLTKVLESIKIPKNNEYTRTLATHSNIILHYLNEETELRAEEGKLISNQQTRFLYELLHLLNFIKDEHIQSNPEDYIRSLVARPPLRQARTH